MSSAQRINNGTAVQVRVGVLQGVGPMGPRGLKGEEGLRGPTGPQGATGEMGAIARYATQVNVGTTNTIAQSSEGNVVFSTTAFDDLSAVISSSTFRPNSDGDYLLSAWIETSVAGTPAGHRTMRFRKGSTQLAVAQQVAPAASGSTYLWMTYPVRYSGSELLTVTLSHGDNENVSVTAGGFTIARFGAGQQGIQGPTGATGSVGPTGPQGDPGPTGSASGGFATYDDLLP